MLVFDNNFDAVQVYNIEDAFSHLRYHRSAYHYWYKYSKTGFMKWGHKNAMIFYIKKILDFRSQKLKGE